MSWPTLCSTKKLLFFSPKEDMLGLRMARMLLFTKYKSVSLILSFLYCPFFLTYSGCWIKHFYLQRMRKNLLRLIHVKEFAPEAQFLDPCPSFILPNVICRYVDLTLVVLVIYLQNILVKTISSQFVWL